MKRSWVGWGLLLCALLLAIALLIFLSQPTSQTIVDERAGARVEFTAESAQVLLPVHCVPVRWQVEGISEVYINSEGTVGEGMGELCPWTGNPKLRVIFRDGTETTYTLPIRVLTYTPAFMIILIGIGICLCAGVWLLNKPLMQSLFRDVESIAAKLAAGWLALLKHPLWVVGFLTFVGVALRISQITHFSLVLDEAAMWQIASGTWAEVLAQNVGNSAPPLFALALNSWMHIGASELWLRLLPAFASIIVIPAIFVLGSRVFNRNAGYFCAIVFVAAAEQTSFAQYLREYSLAILLAVLVLLTYWNYLKRSSRRHLLALVLVWSIGIATNYGLWLMIAGLNIAFLVEWALKPRTRQAMVWLGGQAIVALVAGVMVLAALRFQIGGGGAESWYAIFYWNGLPASLATYTSQGVTSLTLNALGGNYSYPAWGIFALIGLTVVLFEPFRRPIVLMCVMPLAIALLGGLVSLYPYLGTRQMILFTPIPVLLAGIGFSYLCGLRERRALRVFASGLFLIGLVGSLAGVDSFYRRVGYEHTRPVIAALEGSYQPGDHIFTNLYGHPALNYYFISRSPERISAVTQGIGNEAPDFAAQLDALLAEPGRHWIFMNCCQESIEQYLAGRGLSPTPLAQNRDVTLYLIEQN